MTTPSSAVKARAGSVRVLIVDHDLDELRRVRDLLHTRAEFHVSGVRDPLEIGDLVEDGGFDVAVVDGTTWSEAGVGLLRRLEERSPGVSVIVLATEEETGWVVGDDANDVLSRESLGDGRHLAERILHSVEGSRSGRRRDTIVRWLERDARTDRLSGLHNRAAFDERLAEVCARSKQDGSPVALLVVDVCGTSQVNEAYGRDEGDALIQRAGSGLARSVRAIDFAARIDGDTFGLIIDQADLSLARRIARRFVHEVERLNATTWATEIPVEVCFGLAAGVGPDPAPLLEAAADHVSKFIARSAIPAPFYIIRGDEDGPSVA